MILLLFLIPLASAISIEPGVVINTTVSNSSITFSFNVTINEIQATSNNIYLEYVTYVIEGQTYVCPEINWNTENKNLDSSEFNCQTGGGVPPPDITDEFDEADMIQRMFIRGIVCFIIIAIFLIIIFILEILRRKKKISFFTMILIASILALVLFLLCYIIQAILIYQQIEINLLIMLVLFILGAIVMVAVAYLTETMKKDSQLDMLWQIIIMVLVGVAIAFTLFILTNQFYGRTFVI